MVQQGELGIGRCQTWQCWPLLLISRLESLSGGGRNIFPKEECSISSISILNPTANCKMRAWDGMALTSASLISSTISLWGGGRTVLQRKRAFKKLTFTIWESYIDIYIYIYS